MRQVSDLSTMNEMPLTKKDLKPGSSLVAYIDGCPYPVEVVGSVGKKYSFKHVVTVHNFSNLLHSFKYS